MNALLPRHWARFRWESSYAALPSSLHRAVRPTKVPSPALVVLNEEFAGALGLDAQALVTPEGVAFLAGNGTVEGVEPLAQAYAGHQFGYFTVLGDGRALLVGEHRTPDGRLVDVQWKGSGRTMFSRSGDGRLALGPALREYLMSEAMAAMGIPTTRSLAVVTTGETVHREKPLRGAVLLRVASSHVRVGTFEWARVGDDPAALPSLVDFCLERHYPAVDRAQPLPQRALALFRSVLDAQASLVARWMSVGFIHGVMNTDNTTISGETLDYGPCAFLDTYAPGTVFSSIDQHGRYAYGYQPGITAWNLARLGDTLLPMLDADADRAVAIANEVLDSFAERFGDHFTAVFGAKLGLVRPERADMALVQELLSVAERDKLDFHEMWTALSDAVTALLGGASLETLPAPVRAWAPRWLDRLRRDGDAPAEIAATMRNANPRIIPRNHRVEAALAAAQGGDMAPFQRLLLAVRRPFVDAADTRELGAPPARPDPTYRTFCGT